MNLARICLAETVVPVTGHAHAPLPDFIPPSKAVHPAPHILLEHPVRSLCAIALLFAPQKDGSLYFNTMVVLIPDELRGAVESDEGLTISEYAMPVENPSLAWVKIIQYANEQWKPFITAKRSFAEVVQIWKDHPDFFYTYVDTGGKGRGDVMARRTTLMALLWLSWMSKGLLQKECIEELVKRGCPRMTESAFKKESERLGLPSLRRSRRS